MLPQGFTNGASSGTSYRAPDKALKADAQHRQPKGLGPSTAIRGRASGVIAHQGAAVQKTSATGLSISSRTGYRGWDNQTHSGQRFLEIPGPSCCGPVGSGTT